MVFVEINFLYPKRKAIGPFLRYLPDKACLSDVQLLTVPALPWLMAIDPPNECQYVLGYYRPGECAPYVIDPIPYSVRAAVVEGGVATALIFLIP